MSAALDETQEGQDHERVMLSILPKNLSGYVLDFLRTPIA